MIDHAASLCLTDDQRKCYFPCNPAYFEYINGWLGLSHLPWGQCQGIQAETGKDLQNSGRFGNTIRVLGAGV